MKIFFISDGLSLKTGQGIGARRNLAVVKNLSSEIEIYSLEDGKQSQIIDDVKYIGYNVSIINKIFDLLNFRYYYSKKTEKLILTEISKFKPDLIFIDSSNLGNLSRKISKINPNIITYFIDFNLMKISEMLFKYGIKRIFHIYALFFNELFSIFYSKAAFMLTNREKNYLFKFYRKLRIFILPISIEDKFTLDLSSIENNQNSKSILFVGANYYPNILGINSFLKNAFPYLVDYNLIITGKDLEKAEIKINKDDLSRVSIRSNVTDYELNELYRSSNVVICPIFHGGGMKIKFAEALMHGKVLVASKFAAEGFEYIQSNDIYISENINEFIQNIKNACDTLGFKIKYSEDNRELFLNNYTYNNSSKIIQDALIYTTKIQ